jgi:hypothetical protein
MLEAAGFRELDGATDERVAFHTFRELAAVASGLPVWDRARVYVAGLEHFETLGINPPDITEALFFDDFVPDISQFASESVRDTPGDKRGFDDVIELAGDEKPGIQINSTRRKKK